uniref:hypothetical protein n=1 Tax=Muricomes intestini TaxID=1796634 RepID=UPI002FDFFFAC
GGTVNSQFEFTNKAIQGVDITKNAKGDIVYDAKLNTVENTLKDYNLTLETNRKQIQENVDIAEKEAGNLRSYWDGTQYGIGRYEEETTDAVTTLASILSSGNVEVNTDAVPEYSVNTESGVISMSGTDYPILTVGETIEDGAAVALNKEVLDVFLQAYLEEYKGLIKSTATYSVGEGTDITDGVRIEVLIKDTLPVCDPSKFVKTNDPDNPYDGTNPSSTNIKEVNEIFDDMIETRLAFDTAAEGDFKIDTTISGKLEDVQEAVNVDVINPLEENKSLINSQYKESYEKSAGVLLDFQNQLGLYDPMQHLNQSVIQDSYTDMQSNGSDMQKTITERDASQSKTLSNTYTTYAENQTKLQDNVKSATKASNEAVAEGLSGAKSVKVNNSAENQLLLQAFTQKLPYTRIGTLENTMAAEFIISPLYVSEEASAVDQAQADTQEKAAASVGAVSAVDDEKDDESNSSKAVPTLVVLLGVLLLGAAIGKTLSNRGAKDKNSTDIK